MFIKLIWFLYAYYAFLALWAVMALVAVYHILKFGFKGVLTYLSALSFVLVSLAILSVSFAYIGQVDWQTQMVIFNNSFSGSSSLGF